MVRAAFTALQMLRDPNRVARLRGKDVEDLMPTKRRAAAVAAEPAGTTV